ncbi:MAG TPA: DPP IV N-terminal domain-containing protein [Gemmatimonadaceae bacterium]
MSLRVRRPLRRRLLLIRPLTVLAVTLVAGAPAVAQTAPKITAADYDRAVRFLRPNVDPLVIGGEVVAHWLPDGRFWYRSEVVGGHEFVMVNPARKGRAPAFDHAAIAAAISKAMDSTFGEKSLPFQSFDVAADGKSIEFDAGKSHWKCEFSAAACTALGAREQPERSGRLRGSGDSGVESPDGKKVAFIRDWNLWVRDAATGEEKQLTTDGVENFGYATDNAGWKHSDRAILLWSPDSKKIATQQQDERNVGNMYVVHTSKRGHPVLQSWKYPLPGDSVVAMLERVVIDVESGKVVRLKMPRDYHRATLGDDISMDDYQFSPDGSKLALVSTSRDHKSATFRIADTETGDVRTVFDETVPTQFESRTGWRVLWGTNELIWYSQRDNWGQLYLYDLNTGKLKNKITDGEGPVSQIVRVDEKARTVWYVALGREPGQDPYFRHLYSIGLDGKRVASLTPEVGDHTVQLSPDARYIVDTYSQPAVPPVAVLRDAKGKVVMQLEKADISRLIAMGWKPPISVKMKGPDGKTDIFGQMFVPTNLDSTKKYPIINNPYPGPQSGSVGSRSFAAARGDRQALAELGFVVVTIDGMGTPNRSKSFHDHYYGAMGRDNTLPSQITGMKELAERYTFIDIDRVGIYGHSGGGFITADAMFRYPDFFDVGISESGNHDQRQYEDDWGERYQGLLVRNADGSDNYDVEANQNFAGNLKGHLLLAHGAVDDNVPPYNTLLVVDALIKANKDFDLLIIPNARHGYGVDSDYMMRRRWDYFVKWLLDAEPPKEYDIGAATRVVGSR